ncbi:MOSC domain-containing protein [Dyadobacter sp. CY312]|uniref:MOSC domain-containing protein n=1 Tax=Dyadobacter sp. CY312 TaxID=2907303 RepID=UPI001F462F5F|nr:MOSC N-terminal beta barrel domain-containing protein [Dyadobacter sp. CY312]MCE7042411.1 MOSC domain-containing protein [Dyadobacter sp. CY312]
MHLSEIWIYPVKSLGGIRLEEALVQEKGLQYDRRWMVVDEAGKFMTQRNHPSMALISTAINASELVLSDHENPGDYITVSLDPKSNDTGISVQIWKDTVQVMVAHDDVNAWLSTKLGKHVRLVRMFGDRNMNPDDAPDGVRLSFADDFPYLLTTEASLNDLNTRLENTVNMSRFRPNFIISGTSPFEEDGWGCVRIGAVQFLVSKPCERCVLINVDQSKGIRGVEPLKTLASYRKENRKIIFGQNLIAQSYGIVRRGDLVEICS